MTNNSDEDRIAVLSLAVEGLDFKDFERVILFAEDLKSFRANSGVKTNGPVTVSSVAFSVCADR